jgi:hypothetical protein
LFSRHCEAQRAEAIQSRVKILDCFRRRPSGYGGHVASLAMTGRMVNNDGLRERWLDESCASRRTRAWP